MKDKSYQPTKDTSGHLPVNSVSGIPEIDPLNILAENRRLKAENEILCRIAILRGNESQRLKKKIDFLEKERDDSFEKGYQNGIDNK